MLIHTWIPSITQGEHGEPLYYYRDMWRGVRFQKSISVKHISLTAFRGKHGSLGISVRGNTHP